MSVTYQVTVWCDECGQWDQMSTNASTARRKLKRQGWTRSRASDYCPHCTKKRKEVRDERAEER